MRVRVRPRQVRLADPANNGSAEHALAGRVLLAERLGEESYIHLRLAESEETLTAVTGRTLLETNTGTRSDIAFVFNRARYKPSSEPYWRRACPAGLLEVRRLFHAGAGRGRRHRPLGGGFRGGSLGYGRRPVGPPNATCRWA